MVVVFVHARHSPDSFGAFGIRGRLEGRQDKKGEKDEDDASVQGDAPGRRSGSNDQTLHVL